MVFGGYVPGYLNTGLDYPALRCYVGFLHLQFILYHCRFGFCTALIVVIILTDY